MVYCSAGLPQFSYPEMRSQSSRLPVLIRPSHLSSFKAWGVVMPRSAVVETIDHQPSGFRWLTLKRIKVGAAALPILSRMDMMIAHLMILSCDVKHKRHATFYTISNLVKFIAVYCSTKIQQAGQCRKILWAIPTFDRKVSVTGIGAWLVIMPTHSREAHVIGSALNANVRQGKALGISWKGQ